MSAIQLAPQAFAGLQAATFNFDQALRSEGYRGHLALLGISTASGEGWLRRIVSARVFGAEFRSQWQAGRMDDPARSG